MTQLSKTAIALLLLAGGFIAARTFGPPDLAERLVDPWRPAPSAQWGDLQPSTAADYQAERLAPLDAVELPASLSAAQSVPQPQQTTAPLPWPAMPGAPPSAEPAPGAVSQAADTASPWPGASGVQPSTYETDMVQLRRPGAGPVAPASAQPPQAWEVAKPQASDAWRPADAAGPPTKEVSVGLPPAPPLSATGEFAPWGAPPTAPEATSYDPAPAPVSVAQAPALTMPVWGEAAPDAMATLAGPPDVTPGAAEGGRTHVVADGDSLPRLARRYLGDESRSGEIYEHNRDVLTHPDLLPLGVELQLP